MKFLVVTKAKAMPPPEIGLGILDAMDAISMTGVPVEDRTVLLSDNNAGYISR